MRHIYATLDAGGVGVFESPTGTVRRGECLFARKRHAAREARAERPPASQGKTLSLLCAALTWLSDAQAAAAEPKLPPPVDDDGACAGTPARNGAPHRVAAAAKPALRLSLRASCAIPGRLTRFLFAQSRTGFATTAATRRAPKPSAPPRSARSAASACAKPPAGRTPWALSWCVASLPPSLHRALSAPADRIAPLPRCPRRPGRALRRLRLL